MARVKQEKSYTNFRGGFITEATPLAFPENTCRDINNCDIQLDGSVRRRLGFNIETGGGPLNPVFGLGAVAPQDSWAVTKHPWKAVAGRASLNFMVFQVGHYLIVRDWDADVVSSVGAIGSKVTGATEFTIPAAFHFLPTSLTPEREATPLSSASGFGRLWFTSPIHKPFYMEMDELGQLSLNELYTEEYGPTVRLAMRDFAGIEEPLRSDERPTTLSDEHLYNLFNQGWRRDYMTEVRSNRGTYPSNAEQWHAARQTSPDGIDVGLLSNIEFGNSLSPRGHTVLDVLRPDRRYGSERSVFTIPGLGTQYNDVALTSFSAVGFANGRLWLAGEINPKRPNGIYFSKILTKAQDAAVFMQVGDPCAEFFADILATDGGVIYIPEADTIERLEPYGAGILAFAHNGVWFIYGQERGFTADNYSVEKISSTGILGPRTVVRTDDSVFYWADNNIRTVAMPDRGVVPVVVDVSQDKIYTYYGLIPREARVTADACFDNVSKRVFWSWRQADSYSYPQYQSFFNRVLVLDTRTGAYSKYDFRLDEDNNFGIGVLFPKRTLSKPVTAELVTVGGVTVTVAADEVTLFVETAQEQEFINSVKGLILNGPSDDVWIGEFNSLRFADLQNMPGDHEYVYVSDLTTAPEGLGDLIRNKQIPFLHTLFNRTETGFELNGSGQLIAKNPSGCTVQAMWDWHKTNAGKRWSDSQRAYRQRRPYLPTGTADSFDTGEEVVYTRLKIRGTGRSVTLKYTSVDYHDFQLLGYAIPYDADGQD